MNKTAIKKILAWLGIAVILGLFLYMSIQSYQLVIKDDKTVEQGVEMVSHVPPEETESRVNWAEVVVLLVVGTGLIYAIRKIDEEAKHDEAD